MSNILTTSKLLLKNKSVLHKMSGADATALRRKLNELSQNQSVVGENMTKAGNDDETLNERLKKLINQAPVVLFMKGTPQEPRCGTIRETGRH